MLIGVHLTNLKKLFERRLIFFLMKKSIHIMNPPKSKIEVYVSVRLFILYPIWVHVEIQNDLPKITKIKWICYFLTNSGQKSLLCLFHHILTTIQLNLKNSEIKKIKSYTSSGIRTRNPWVWGYGTPAQ